MACSHGIVDMGQVPKCFEHDVFCFFVQTLIHYCLATVKLVVDFIVILESIVLGQY